MSLNKGAERVAEGTGTQETLAASVVESFVGRFADMVSNVALGDTEIGIKHLDAESHVSDAELLGIAATEFGMEHMKFSYQANGSDQIKHNDDFLNITGGIDFSSADGNLVIPIDVNLDGPKFLGLHVYNADTGEDHTDQHHVVLNLSERQLSALRFKDLDGTILTLAEMHARTLTAIRQDLRGNIGRWDDVHRLEAFFDAEALQAA